MIVDEDLPYYYVYRIYFWDVLKLQTVRDGGEDKPGTGTCG